MDMWMQNSTLMPMAMMRLSTERALRSIDHRAMQPSRSPTIMAMVATCSREIHRQRRRAMERRKMARKARLMLSTATCCMSRYC